jgi:hypothetical protein
MDVGDSCRPSLPRLVIPAKAGIHIDSAVASRRDLEEQMDPGFRRDDSVNGFRFRV